MDVTNVPMTPEITAELAKETAVDESNRIVPETYVEESTLAYTVDFDHKRMDGLEARIVVLEAEALKNFGKIKEKTRLLD